MNGIANAVAISRRARTSIRNELDELGWDAYTHVAINEAHRAARELAI